MIVIINLFISVNFREKIKNSSAPQNGSGEKLSLRFSYQLYKKTEAEKVTIYNNFWCNYNIYVLKVNILT